MFFAKLKNGGGLFSVIATKKKSDFTEGNLFLPIFLFVIPIILTGMLQILYNMADNIVVGRWSGDELALAAVGSTTSLANLMVNLLMGIAGGAGVVVAQSLGARKYSDLSRAVHTALTFSLIAGVVFSVFGLIISEPALELMGTKSELMSRALLYLRIICLGIPASSVYNFGAAVLRSVGDARTPLVILASTGITNVLLNLLFVIAFHMSVDGVATATIIAQYISAVAVVLVLIYRKKEKYALDPRQLGIDKNTLLRILRLGLPAGIQGSLFGISNVIITGAINSLATTDIAAKTIAINIEGLVYTAMNSYLHAAMTFTGQNYGAKKLDRIKKVMLYTLIQVAVIGIIGGQLINLFGKELAALYVEPGDPNKEIILETAATLMTFMLSTYFLCGLMDTLSGILRGLGYSLAPMIISIGAICGLRILWILFVFPTESFNSLLGLYTVYPISWLSGLLLLVGVLIFAFRRIRERFSMEDTSKSAENT